MKKLIFTFMIFISMFTFSFEFKKDNHTVEVNPNLKWNKNKIQENRDEIINLLENHFANSFKEIEYNQDEIMEDEEMSDVDLENYKRLMKSSNELGKLTFEKSFVIIEKINFTSEDKAVVNLKYQTPDIHNIFVKEENEFMVKLIATIMTNNEEIQEKEMSNYIDEFINLNNKKIEKLKGVTDTIITPLEVEIEKISGKWELTDF